MNPYGPRVQTPEEFAVRFWSYVDRSPGYGPNGDCWLWTGTINGPTRSTTGGHGQISWGCKRVGAHRAAYMLAVGPIPRGLCVCHRCDVRACCNPAHLFVGTMADNTRDMFDKGRANKAKGERHGRAKLTDEAVAAMRESRAAGRSFASLAREYGVSYTVANRAITGRTWAHVPAAVAP